MESIDSITLQVTYLEPNWYIFNALEQLDCISWLYKSLPYSVLYTVRNFWINLQHQNNPKVGLGLTTLMVEFAHNQGLEKSSGTQMNFWECILGNPSSFRGSNIIPTFSTV